MVETGLSHGRSGLMSIQTPRVICVLLVTVVASALQAVSVGAKARPSARGAVGGIKVLPDKAPDCTSLKSIAATVTRGCKTNDAKAIAIYNFMLLSHYHRAYPSEPGGVPALKVINTYGWSLCGGLHSVQSALWRELGWDWRFVGWRGHTTVEAKYDGRWHYLDVFLKFYAWMPDPNAPDGRTIAGEGDLTRNMQALVAGAFVLDPSRRVVYAKNNQFELIGDKANWTAPALLNCGDTLGSVMSGLKTHRPGGPSEGWMGIKHATGGYRAEVDLAPGTSLTNTWDGVEGAWHWGRSKQAPRHTCNNKDLRNCPAAGLVLEPYYQRPRSYANGSLVYAPDFSSAAWLKGLAASENVAFRNGALVPARAGSPGSITVGLSSPYIKTPTSDFIKWPKTAGEKGRVPALVYLIGGKLKPLPALKDIASARLVFSVVRAHHNAPTKVGAVALRAAFQAGRPYDFAKLGDLLGTAVVPKLPANVPDWAPPKQFRIDVTSLVRRIAAGDATFHGLALRVVPDRGVDDGWTVRIHIPKRPQITLEIDTYQPAPTTPRHPTR